ncbi:uncharacterized protein LOC114358281 [Ostrinia furnacalis]|uniref:uncharacterized protein LOC114358281 n=1 Tax=Ostrinia furnacalis TaxID=93504 RepID=UPI00103EAA41|nr:uncharacterized protein LOC114358281 [Ostrinia furnacalis]
MAPQISKVERQRIIALRRSGCRVKEICAQTGITRKTVYFWIRRWEEEGTLEANHRQHYERVTTEEEDAAIVAAHNADPRLSTRVSSATYKASVRTRRASSVAHQASHRRHYERVTTEEEDAAIVAAHAADPRLSTRVSSATYKASVRTRRASSVAHQASHRRHYERVTTEEGSARESPPPPTRRVCALGEPAAWRTRRATGGTTSGSLQRRAQHASLLRHLQGECAH